MGGQRSSSSSSSRHVLVSPLAFAFASCFAFPPFLLPILNNISTRLARRRARHCVRLSVLFSANLLLLRSRFVDPVPTCNAVDTMTPRTSTRATTISVALLLAILFVDQAHANVTDATLNSSGNGNRLTWSGLPKRVSSPTTNRNPPTRIPAHLLTEEGNDVDLKELLLLSSDTTKGEDEKKEVNFPSINLSVQHHGRLYPLSSTYAPHAEPETKKGRISLLQLTGKPFLPALGRKKAASVDQELTGDSTSAAGQPTASALAAVIQPIIPSSEWDELTGREFQSSASALDGLATLGIDMANMESSQRFVDWTPSKATASLLDGNNDNNEAIIEAISDPKDGTVMVWTGKWKQPGHGSHLPVVRTVSVLPMSPRNFADLLMDSSKVQSYNKMSLGRTDVDTMQSGIDTVDGTFGGIDGEAKVVRNLTQPPLSKKKMEFVTVMHARRMRLGDKAGLGYLGGTGNENDNDGGGYVVVSRAVNDGGPNAAPTATNGGGNAAGGDGEEFTRSEILLGVNLVRPVPGREDQCEVTAITHCNSPSVPLMIAGKIGVKGAVDFVKDIRSM